MALSRGLLIKYAAKAQLVIQFGG